ncbi:MAG: cytochrome c [Acidobacteria bacterium]|nr:cytochrome c [Acidobacteriota bacterium]
MNPFAAHRLRAGAVVRLFTLFLLLAAAGARGQTQGPAPKGEEAPAGNVENGRKIYKSYGCYQCHGYAAHGGPGGRLAPNPISFKAFVEYVREPKNQMPPYTSRVVSDLELADIYAFLRSLPKPPEAKNIPLLND